MSLVPKEMRGERQAEHTKRKGRSYTQENVICLMSLLPAKSLEQSLEKKACPRLP